MLYSKKEKKDLIEMTLNHFIDIVHYYFICYI